MDLSKILSISGMGGLFKVIAQGKNGLIVESLADKKRMPVHSSNKISVLDNISMYVNNGDTVPLGDVLKKIYEKKGGQPALDSKSTDDELKNFFESVLSEYDKEKVHISDIRKTIQWYNLLQKTDIFNAPTLTGENQEEEKKISLNKDENEKSHFRDLGQPNQGKHLNPTANVAKKTLGVRKTGVA